MLKTTSTKSADPRKDVVGVGVGGKNRAGPVDKYKVDGIDNGIGSSGDFVRKFHLRLQYGSHTTHLDAQDKLINGFINWCRLPSSMMRLIVVLASWSKSCQKIEESSKSPKNLKGLKSCKSHWFGEMFIKKPILYQCFH